MNFKKIVVVLGILAVALISALFFVPKKSNQPAETKKLFKFTYGVSPYQDTILPIVAQQQGWYQQEGLECELKVVEWGNVMASVVSGAADVALYNFPSFQAQYENMSKGGGDIIFYYPLYIFRGSAVVVHGGGDIKPLSEFSKQYSDNQKKALVEALKQLKGKSILVTRGTDSEQVVLSALKKAGLSEKDVKITHAQLSDALMAFLRKEGDVFSGGVTECTEAHRHGAVTLVDSADLNTPMINCLMTTKKFADAHPDVLKKLIKLWFKTIRFMEEDLDQRCPAVIEYLGSVGSTKYTVDEYKYTWFNTETYFKSPEEIQKNLFNPESPSYWKKTWDTNNSFLLSEGKIKNAIPYEAFWGEKVQLSLPSPSPVSQNK